MTLIQCHAKTLHQAALGLYARQIRVDHRAAVHAGSIFNRNNLAGLRIHINFCHTDHVRRRRYRTVAARGDALPALRTALQLIGQLFQRDAAARAHTSQNFAVKRHFILRAFQTLCRLLRDVLAQLLRRLDDGIAGQIRGRRCIGAGIIRRGIGIYTVCHNVIQIALENVRRHLRQNGITAGTHVCTAHKQTVKTVIVHLDGDVCLIDKADAAALHRHRHADTANMAVRQGLCRKFAVPVHHFFAPRHTLIQRAGIGGLIVVRRHNVSLVQHIVLTNFYRINAQLMRHQIDRVLHRKDALRCAVAAICARTRMIAVHGIRNKAKCFIFAAVQRNGLVSYQTDGRRSVLTVCAGV